jgi:hypothetical protein
MTTYTSCARSGSLVVPKYQARAQHHWIAALQGRVDLIPTDEIALNTMLIMEGIYLSHWLGREVTAEEVKAESRSTAVRV